MVTASTAVAVVLAAQLIVAIIAYAAWERRNSDYQYSQGQLDTLNHPEVVHKQHVDTAHDLNIAQEEHTNTKNSLTSDRTPLEDDGN